MLSARFLLVCDVMDLKHTISQEVIPNMWNYTESPCTHTQSHPGADLRHRHVFGMDETFIQISSEAHAHDWTLKDFNRRMVK